MNSNVRPEIKIKWKPLSTTLKSALKIRQLANDAYIITSDVHGSGRPGIVAEKKARPGPVNFFRPVPGLTEREEKADEK